MDALTERRPVAGAPAPAMRAGATPPVALRVRLLGTMEAVTGDGLSVLPRARKARALLAVLVLLAPEKVARTTLAGLLWSRSRGEQARGSLRQALLDLQDSLASGGVDGLRSGREHLCFAAHGVTTDLPAPGDAAAARLLEDLRGVDPAFDAWVRARIDERMTPPGAGISAGRPRLGLLGLRAAPSSGAAAEGLADGFGRELVAALTRRRWLTLPSRLRPDTGTGTADGGATADHDYALDGAVEMEGRRLRVHLALHDLRTGDIVWTHSADAPEGGRFDLQRALASEAAGRLDAALLRREARRLSLSAPASLTPDAALIVALPAIAALEPRAHALAGTALRAAVAAAPGHAPAHAWLSFWHTLGLSQGWAASPGAALHLAERAMQLDPGDAQVLTLAGHALCVAGRRPDLAVHRHEAALARDPSLASAWLLHGFAQACLGHATAARAATDRGRRLCPDDIAAPLGDVTEQLAALLSDEADVAVALGRRVVALRPTCVPAMILLLAALGMGGATAEAAGLRDRVGTAGGTATAEAAMACLPVQRLPDRRRLAAALVAAGLPA